LSLSNDGKCEYESARSWLAPAVKRAFVFDAFQNLDGDKSPAQKR
jgi:hypothetical protein